jgi:O-methyltransferase domain/Dimerisation domain
MRDDTHRGGERLNTIPYEQLKPSTDDKAVRDLQFALYANPAVLVAYELGLFRHLASGPMTAAEVSAALKVSARAAEALLAVCSAWGFTEKNRDSYTLSAVGGDYLAPSGAAYVGPSFDRIIENSMNFSYTSIKEAVVTSEPQGAWGRDIFDYSSQVVPARRVTETMHTRSLAPSFAWPNHIDLSSHRVLLDIGGGSGAHAMGAVTRWPHLRAIVLDHPPVCEVAEEFIARHGLSGRIATHAADMFAGRFPAADVHFYSNVLHDWPPEAGSLLVAKSFEALPAGGLIILHEMLFNDDKTGPASVAGFNVMMLAGMLGQQYSAAELRGMIESAGFVESRSTPTFGDCSIVTGYKPG